MKDFSVIHLRSFHRNDNFSGNDNLGLLLSFRIERSEYEKSFPKMRVKDFSVIHFCSLFLPMGHIQFKVKKTKPKGSILWQRHFYGYACALVFFAFYTDIAVQRQESFFHSYKTETPTSTNILVKTDPLVFNGY